MRYTKDPRVDAYIDPLPHWQQEICHQVRDVVHAADPAVEETICRLVDAGSFPVVDRLLGETESARTPPADLDDDQRGRRTRVDRHEIELMAADMDVSGQDGPSGHDQPVLDERLGSVTRQLGRCPGRIGRWRVHARKVRRCPSTGTYPGLHC